VLETEFRSQKPEFSSQNSEGELAMTAGSLSVRLLPGKSVRAAQYCRSGGGVTARIALHCRFAGAFIYWLATAACKALAYLA